MNFINTHIENENVAIELSELKPHEDKEYRILNLGFNTNIFLTEEQAEKLFDELDKKLHKDTYSDMQDRCINLEIDLDNANELIEGLEENLREAM